LVLLGLGPKSKHIKGIEQILIPRTYPTPKHLKHSFLPSSFSVQSCRRSRNTGSGIGKCSTASRTLSSTRRKLSLCHGCTTRGHRSRGLKHTQRSDACRSVERASWVGSSSGDRVRSTIPSDSRRRRINGISDDRAARIDGRVWLSTGYSCWLHCRGIFLLSYGFGEASSAGAWTCCASLCAAIGGRNGCCGCHSAGGLDTVQSWTTAGSGIGD